MLLVFFFINSNCCVLWYHHRQKSSIVVQTGQIELFYYHYVIDGCPSRKEKSFVVQKNFSSKHQWIKVFGQVSITFFRLCLRTGEKSFFLFCTLIACNVTFDTNLSLLFLYLSLLSILPPSNGSRSKSDSSIILFISL